VCIVHVYIYRYVMANVRVYIINARTVYYNIIEKRAAAERIHYTFAQINCYRYIIMHHRHHSAEQHNIIIIINIYIYSTYTIM
jgi:hypothetical protein